MDNKANEPNFPGLRKVHFELHIEFCRQVPDMGMKSTVAPLAPCIPLPLAGGVTLDQFLRPVSNLGQFYFQHNGRGYAGCRYYI